MTTENWENLRDCMLRKYYVLHFHFLHLVCTASCSSK